MGITKSNTRKILKKTLMYKSVIYGDFENRGVSQTFEGSKNFKKFENLLQLN